jgi:hypothetical protein
MLTDTLAALFPLAIGLALFPQILLTALLLSTTADGRRKDLALMLGIVSGACLATGLLVVLAIGLGEPMGGRGRAIAAGLISLFFGLTFLAGAVRGVWGLTVGGKSFADIQAIAGLAVALEHITPATAFRRGLLSGTWNQQAPLVLMPAAVLIAQATLPLGQTIAAVLAFAGMTGLGVAVIVGLVALPEAHTERGLLRLRGWLEAHGGAVLLALNALLAVVLLTKAMHLLQAPSRPGPQAAIAALAPAQAPWNAGSNVALSQKRAYDLGCHSRRAIKEIPMPNQNPSPEERRRADVKPPVAEPHPAPTETAPETEPGGRRISGPGPNDLTRGLP